ncbi:MAG: hypothetical protein EBW98_02745 [Actinobacteria bacterium]|nr:hypothetical protein [Actinomycetota bacterium]
MTAAVTGLVVADRSVNHANVQGDAVVAVGALPALGEAMRWWLGDDAGGGTGDDDNADDDASGDSNEGA